MLTQIAHLLDVLEMPGISATENDYDSNCILVDILNSVLRVHDEIRLGLDGNETSFDVPIPKNGWMFINREWPKFNRKLCELSHTWRISQERLVRWIRKRCWDDSGPSRRLCGLLANFSSSRARQAWSLRMIQLWLSRQLYPLLVPSIGRRLRCHD